MTRFELAGMTNQELTVMLNVADDPRTVGFDDCSATTACRTHAINKILTVAGNLDEVWNTPTTHPSIEELGQMGLLDDGA